MKREKASKVIKMRNTISKTCLVLVGFFFSPWLHRLHKFQSKLDKLNSVDYVQGHKVDFSRFA